MNEAQLLEANTDTATLVALGAALGKPQANPHQDGLAYVLKPTPAGIEIEYLKRPDKPHRMKGTVTANDTESFITAVDRYATDGTILYALLHPASFLAVLNDHLATGDADWRDHRVSFTLANSKECNLWHGGQKKDMSQEAFAYFIEDSLPDFKEPTGAKMLEIALNFKVHRKVNFKSAMNLSDGTMQLEYSDLNEGGATGPARRMAMPETFKIEIPVWDGLGAKKYPFEARLRYRVEGGALSIKYELIRPHKVIEQAFRNVLEQVREGLNDVPIIFGKPE